MLNQQLNTAIIDFDGTLADTTETIIETMMQTFETYGITITEHDKDTIKSMIGLPLRDTIAKMSDEYTVNIDEAVIKYRELFDANALNHIELYPNVKDTLQYLHDNDVKLAVASGKGTDALYRLLKKLEIYDLFDCVIGEQDTAPYKKPSQYIISTILDKIDSKSDNTLVIGDTTYDIEMGNKASCRTCAVTYGAHPKEKLMEVIPSYMIDDFAELKDIFVSK